MKKLLQLSDRRGWFRLREALTKLDNANALKTCELISAFFAIAGKISSEKVEAAAASYAAALDYEKVRIGVASKALKHFAEKVESAQASTPEILSIRKFYEYKRAIGNLATLSLMALAELCDFEGRATSLETLKVVHKTIFRQSMREFLHPSSTQHQERYWNEIQYLLEGIEEVSRKPKSSEWSEGPSKRPRKEPGGHLRKDAGRIRKSDLVVQKNWFDLIAPGLYGHVEEETDHVSLLLDIMKREQCFPPVLAHVLQIALLHRDDLNALRDAKDSLT